MADLSRTLLITAFAACVAACGSSNTSTDGSTLNPTDSSTTTDATTSYGMGTCADPYHLENAGMRVGNDIVFEGNTSTLGNELHPYAQMEAMDSSEAVLEFRVPLDMPDVRITSEGSDFDTILYVRDACAQNSNGADIAFSDDTAVAGAAMAETYSTIHMTGLAAGRVLFIVVDGKQGDGASSGRFRVTISPFVPGTSGNPCSTDAMGVTSCSTAGERCSAANVCVPTVANGASCDQSGLSNTCGADAYCVSDPSPVEGDTGTVCATPGTRAGAPCRTDGNECDAPYECNGQMDNPVCVRVIQAEQPCDPMAISNRCAMGLRCRTVNGVSFCEPGA